jgi:hypothetical protein
MQVTKAEYQAIINARKEQNKLKAQAFVAPKAAFVGGAVIGLWDGLVCGFTNTKADEFEIVDTPKE